MPNKIKVVKIIILGQEYIVKTSANPIYFKKIDYVSVLHMVGGETLMYPHFREALDYIGKNFRNKIGHLLISTNGTLVPKEETLNLIKKYSGLVYISDYTDGINYKRKLNQVIESIKKHKINHFALRSKLLIKANQIAFAELQYLKSA